jgi:hypothetical protein
LQTYIDTNIKPRKWVCATCPSDKPIMLYRDEFMEKLLAKTVNESDTKCTITEKLEVKIGNKTLQILEHGFFDPDEEELVNYNQGYIYDNDHSKNEETKGDLN